MYKFIAGGLLIAGLLAGASTASVAAQSVPTVVRPNDMTRIGSIQHADYYYHHHRYHHRAWDKRHRRWHYY